MVYSVKCFGSIYKCTKYGAVLVNIVRNSLFIQENTLVCIMFALKPKLITASRKNDKICCKIKCLNNFEITVARAIGL